MEGDWDSAVARLGNLFRCIPLLLGRGSSLTLFFLAVHAPEPHSRSMGTSSPSPNRQLTFISSQSFVLLATHHRPSRSLLIPLLVAQLLFRRERDYQAKYGPGGKPQ